MNMNEPYTVKVTGPVMKMQERYQVLLNLLRDLRLLPRSKS